MNKLYKKILVLHECDSDYVFQALLGAGHSYSRNWVRGWGLGESSRNYREMSYNELLCVVDALILIV